MILLTAETMHRMWCAGEITTAVRSKIPIVPVACDDYVPPDEPALALLHQVWSEEQKHTLGTYGIDVPMIQGAYRSIKELQALSFKRFASSTEQEAVILKVVERCRLPRSGGSFHASDAASAAQVAVAGNTEDPEALCTCEILREMV